MRIKNTSTHPTPSEFLSAAEVTQATSIARASWYRLIAKNLFPRPIRVPGLRAQRWKAEEVKAWLTAIKEQAARSTPSSPKASRKKA